MTQPTYSDLKRELTNVLDIHIDLLKEVTSIAPEDLDAVMLMMRSFGFMLDRAPEVLLEEDPEEMNFLMFEYYSLLKELKYNLRLNYPYAKMQGKPLIALVDLFPTTFEEEMKAWWEKMTGLTVDDSKQTIEIKDMH